MWLCAAMGSDNPKGAVAKTSVAGAAGKYAAIAATVVVLWVCLSTSPKTTLGVGDIKASGGAGGEGAAAGGVSGGRKAGDGRGALAARYAKAVVGTVDAAAAVGTDHVTAKALPKLAGGGAALSSSTSTGAFASALSSSSSAAPATGLYALKAVDIDGVDTSLSFLQGTITLVTNVASE